MHPANTFLRRLEEALEALDQIIERLQWVSSEDEPSTQ